MVGGEFERVNKKLLATHVSRETYYEQRRYVCGSLLRSRVTLPRNRTRWHENEEASEREEEER